jgi:GTP cyclohydrolase I
MIDKARIQNAVKEILLAIGEDPQREGLLETPRRVADMYEEIFAGLYHNPVDEIKIFEEEYYNNLVAVKDIPLYSVCEHHLIPFLGVAHVVYLPSQNNILGLSKIARIVDLAAKKPQLQERLCSEIADVIMKLSKAEGVLVIIEAEHLCMTMRGIRKPGSKALTIAHRGKLNDDESLKNDALKLIGK